MFFPGIVGQCECRQQSVFVTSLIISDKQTEETGRLVLVQLPVGKFADFGMGIISECNPGSPLQFRMGILAEINQAGVEFGECPVGKDFDQVEENGWLLAGLECPKDHI